MSVSISSRCHAVPVSVCAMLVLLAGCQPVQYDASSNVTAVPATGEHAEPVQAQDATGPQGAPADTTAQVSMQLASWEETQALVASHTGKFVVLDIWSTYCPPCIKELPGLVQLHEQHGDEVACMTLNCNYTGSGSPEDEKEQAQKILARVNANFEHLISTEPDQELYQRIGIASIPVVQVYDRSGKLIKQFDNERNEYGDLGFNYHDHIIPFVEGLLQPVDSE